MGQNNLLDVKLFTPSLAACRDHCERTTECRYYYWYPISYSSAPLYCYLFRQCAIKVEREMNDTEKLKCNR